MYTDEDLNYGVEQGVFTQEAVHEFRALVSSSKNSSSVDEENFRLIGGFNDIFIVIACCLLLFSSLWILNSYNEAFGRLVFVVLSWGLAEFFVRKRKMALPAILLLLAFVGGVFALAISLLPSSSDISMMIASGVTALAALIHWYRFGVPITVAAGTAAAFALVITVIVNLLPRTEVWLDAIMFSCGVLTFLFAMYWDASDKERITRNSDVAFWLHLLAAPFIIHPVFSGLGVQSGDESLFSMMSIITLYLFMTLISLAVDRRVFMVSSLVYVLFALSSLIKTYGGVGYSFAVTGVVIGAALLLLSAYWHPVRAGVVNLFPGFVKRHLPRVVAT